jgi:hypothetical protein
MFAALAVAASLLVAQPFSIVMKAADAAGQVHTFESEGRFPTRAACEAKRAADREKLAANSYVTVLDSEPMRVLGSVRIVRGGTLA